MAKVYSATLTFVDGAPTTVKADVSVGGQRLEVTPDPTGDEGIQDPGRVIHDWFAQKGLEEVQHWLKKDSREVI
jgi:hypothetical protein